MENYVSAADGRMNIYSKKGTKVRVVQISEGVEFPNMEKIKLGEVFTVDHTIEHGWHTDVYLKEFPNFRFNSVCFQEIKGTKNAMGTNIYHDGG
jgi:hypothetical protein